LKLKAPTHPVKGSTIEKVPLRYTQRTEPTKPKLESDQLIDKSLEKKAELDKIVETSKDNSKPSNS